MDLQKSNFIFSKNRNGKFVAHKTRMSVIKCVCGFEILMVPDLKVMAQAIENHVAKHKNASDVSEWLTEQVLVVAANCQI